MSYLDCILAHGEVSDFISMYKSCCKELAHLRERAMLLEADAETLESELRAIQEANCRPDCDCDICGLFPRKRRSTSDETAHIRAANAGGKELP